MKVHYDAGVDAVYIKLGSQKPDGVVEISDVLRPMANLKRSILNRQIR